LPRFNLAFVAYQHDAIMAIDGLDRLDSHWRKALRAGLPKGGGGRIKLVGVRHREISGVRDTGWIFRFPE